MLITKDCTTCEYAYTRKKCDGCCGGYRNWQLAEPSGVLTTAKTKGGTMLPSDLSKNDKVMCNCTECHGKIHTIVRANDEEAYSVYSDHIGEFLITADNSLSRIPITAQNFPADGVVWCEEHKACEIFHTRFYCGHYLPLIKERQGFDKETKPKHNCDNCGYADGEFCQYAIQNDGTCNEYDQWKPIAAKPGNRNSDGDIIGVDNGKVNPVGNQYKKGDKVTMLQNTDNRD